MKRQLDCLLLYSSVLVFTLADLRDIGRQLNEIGGAGRLVGVVRATDIAFAIMVVWLFCRRNAFAFLLRQPYTMFVLLTTGGLALEGLIERRGMDVFWNDDVRTWAMLGMGVIWATIVLRLRRPVVHLAIIGIGFAAIMATSALFDPRSASAGDLVVTATRIGNRNVFNYSALLQVFGGILLVAGLATRHRWALVGAFVVLGVQIFVGAGVAATRSIAACATASIAFGAIAAFRWRIWTRVVVAGRLSVLGFSAALLVAMLGSYKLASRENVFEVLTARLGADAYAIDNVTVRLLEVQTLFTSLNPVEFIIGRGFGGTFPSPSYDGGLAPELHIGIFTFWLKGGVGLFIIAASLLLVYYPWRYFSAILGAATAKTKGDWGILLVFPGLSGIVVLLLSSGGYSQYAFLSVGVGLGVLMHMRLLGPPCIFASQETALYDQPQLRRTRDGGLINVFPGRARLTSSFPLVVKDVHTN